MSSDSRAVWGKQVERRADARRAAAHDSAEEFTAAVRMHLNRLRRLVASQAPRPLAEDVLQDTLLRAFRSWPSFDRSLPLWPWLARIAQRACASAWQADTRWRLVEQSTASLTSSWDSPGSDRHVDALHARAVVTATLANLSDRDRLLVYCSDGEDMARHALAQAVTLTPGAMRVALHRARSRFRAFAADRWDDIGVATAFVVGRLRLRLRTRGSEPALATWALSASVLATLVTTVVAPHPVAREQMTIGVRATAATARGGETPTPDAPPRKTVLLGSPLGSPVPSRLVDRNDHPSDRRGSASSPSPLPTPRAQVDIGREGIYGGLKLDVTSPNESGHVSANPEVRCRHSRATEAVCIVTGSLPSAGPAEFYGSGDGNP